MRACDTETGVGGGSQGCKAPWRPQGGGLQSGSTLAVSFLPWRVAEQADLFRGGLQLPKALEA